MEYLEEARKWSDISGFVRHRPFKIGSGTIKEDQGCYRYEDDEDGEVKL